MIFVTGEILWLTRPYSTFGTKNDVTLAGSLAIGAAQAGALVPGISRSGITIATAMLIGIDRSKAARFSFLLSIPAILGASVLKTREFADLPSDQILPMITAVLAAAVSGYIALRLLLGAVRAGKLHCFAYYCWAVSVVGVALLWTMGF
jgi:undecaprenyl-diphosphatase